MSTASRVLYLRIALIVTGLIFIFGIYPLSIVWPSGWSWGQGHSHYLRRRRWRALCRRGCANRAALQRSDERIAGRTTSALRYATLSSRWLAQV
jgi:hypothetical protein